jgi:hypothetical protein
MPDSNHPKVFISYSSQDRVPAERLVEKLKAEGLDVWTDREIPPGQDWQSAIEKALDEASVLLLVLSDKGLGSQWQQVELGMALRSEGRSRKTVIPVLFSGTDRTSLPSFLRNRLTVNIDPDDEDRAVESIAHAIEASNH